MPLRCSLQLATVVVCEASRDLRSSGGTECHKSIRRRLTKLTRDSHFLVIGKAGPSERSIASNALISRLRGLSIADFPCLTLEKGENPRQVFLFGGILYERRFRLPNQRHPPGPAQGPH